MNGLEVSVEIVGGDVWNAYAGGLQAVPALEAILFEAIHKVEVRTLQTIPGERQIRLSGVEALRSGARRLQPSNGEDIGDQKEHRRLSTQKIDMRAVVSELRTANTSTGRSEDVPETPDDRFERLLARGIEASLSRDYPRAGRAFEEALILRPDEPRVRHNLERIRRHL